MSDWSTVHSLQGSWQMVRAEHDGQHAPDFVAEQTILELSAGLYRVSYSTKAIDEGQWIQTHAGIANSFTFRGERGPNAGRSIGCIFQHVGDRLRICYGLDGSTPAAFTTSAGANRYLATYRRLPTAKLSVTNL
ncbi:MAG: hypothetical protein ABIZ04_20580 [Opitutus sp.]